MRTSVLVLVVVAAMAAPALAGETVIGGSSEQSIASILDGLYGAGNYSRWQDTPGPLNTWDQTWIGSGQALAMAKYAGYTHTFGWIDSGNAFHGLNIHLPGDFAQLSTVGTFKFGLQTSAGDLWSSLESANSDHLDHMITFRITGNAGGFSGNRLNNWILAWDDQAGGGDRDFNDLVVEVGSISRVPEPGTLALLGTGIAGLVGYARRRRTARA